MAILAGWPISILVCWFMPQLLASKPGAAERIYPAAPLQKGQSAMR
jgi:hypothetical protein